MYEANMTGHSYDNYWWRNLVEPSDELETRERILVAAYQEIHLNGFQAASLSHILKRAGVTKGALYHHFKNKSDLGKAVIEEIIYDQIMQGFTQPLEQFENPVDGLINLIEGAGCSFSMKDIQLGCPLHNLAQEMAPIDEKFRIILNAIYQKWIEVIEQKLCKGQLDGYVKEEVDCQQMAILITATLEGCLSAAKITQNLDSLTQCGAGLIQHLNFIRA